MSFILPSVVLCASLLSSPWGGPGLRAAEAPMSPVPQRTNLPVVTIRQFLDGARGWGETNFLRLQGVVTASLRDKTYFLQDGDVGVYVFHRPATALRVGEWVEVTGHPSLGSLKPLLDGVAVRSLGSRALPPAIAVTFAEAISGQHHMRLIRIQGRLAEERPRGGRSLVLNAGGTTNSFLAELEVLSDDEVARIPTGSLLELTGVCSVRADAARLRPISLTVFARSAADVVVVSGPPWWTRERMLAVLGLVLGALGLALLWAWMLRRQVRQQTADLRSRLEKESALEQRYRQLFEANPHPMWVYDLKTLAFLAVNDAASERYGYSRTEFLGLTIKDIRPREDVPTLLENVGRVASGLEAAGIWRHQKKDGSIIEVEISSHTQDFDGRPAALVLAHDVTERRRAEAALRASEQYRHAIIEAEPECVKVIAADGTLLDMNAAGLAMIEAGSLAEVQHCPALRFVRPEYHAAFAELLHRVMAGGSGILEFESEGLKGTRRWLETHAVQLPGTEGAKPALLGITRDITERKRAQAELQRSQEQFATIFRASPDSIMIVRVSDERVLEINPAFTRITGFAGEEVKGRTTGELDLWVEPEERAAVIARMKTTGSVRNVESRLRHKSGRIITALGSAELIQFGGEPCLLSTTRDITDRKRAEEEAQRTLTTLQLFIDSVPGYVSFVDADQRYQFVNHGYEQWFGRSHGEIVGRRLAELHPAAAYEDMRPNVERALAGESVRYERCLPGLDGHPHWFDIRYIPRPAPDGTVAGFFALVFDITKAREADEALRANRERLDGILGSLEDVVWSSTPDGSQMLYLNPAAEKVYGRPAADFFTNPQLWQEVIHPDDHAAVSAAFQELQISETFSSEYRIVRPDGTVRWLLDRSRLVQDAAGRALRLDGIGTDITTQREAEERIRHLNAELEQRVRERTAALEVANQELEAFSYSVSHDLRAPLRAIDGFSNILQQDFGSRLDATALGYLDRIRAGTERMGTLIDDMLKLSRLSRAPMHRVPVDLTLLVRGLLTELQTAEPDRQVETIVEPDLGAEADPSLLRAMLQNLLDNAWKYTSRRPQSRIEFGAIEREGERVFFIRDDGAGFDMAYADKLFDVFQRLHRDDEFEGTGIGLATVQRIIHRHGGRIWAEAAVNRGATFYFTLAPGIERPRRLT